MKPRGIADFLFQQLQRTMRLTLAVAVLLIMSLLLITQNNEARAQSNTTWTATLSSERESGDDEYGYEEGDFGSITDDTFVLDGMEYTIDYIKWDDSAEEVEFYMLECLKETEFVSLQIGSRTFSSPDRVSDDDDECEGNRNRNQEFEFHDVTSNPLRTGRDYTITLTLTGSGSGGGTTPGTTPGSGSWSTYIDSVREPGDDEYGYEYGDFGSIGDRTFVYDGRTYRIDFLKWDDSAEEVEFQLEECLKPSEFTSLTIGSRTFTRATASYQEEDDGDCNRDRSDNQEWEWDTSSNPLPAGQSVNITLSFANGTTTSPTPTATATTTVSAPAAPSGLTKTSGTTTSLRVSWNSVSGASKYSVEYKEDGASSWITAPDSLTSTSYTITELRCGAGYDVRVKSFGDGTNALAQWSGPSATLDATTSSCPADHAALSPAPSTAAIKNVPTTWHRFTVHSSEDVVVVANPGTVNQKFVTWTGNPGIDYCRFLDNEEKKRRSNGNLIYIAGCFVGSATVELRKASDDTVLATYNFVIKSSTPSARVSPGTSTIYVKSLLGQAMTASVSCKISSGSCSTAPADSLTARSSHTFSGLSPTKDYVITTSIDGAVESYAVRTHSIPVLRAVSDNSNTRSLDNLSPPPSFVTRPSSTHLAWQNYLLSYTRFRLDAQQNDYELKVAVPSGTGFRNGTSYTQQCNWNAAPSTVIPWSSSSESSTFDLIRCSVGDVSSKISVRARLANGEEWTYYEFPVRQGWHRKGAKAKYAFTPTTSATSQLVNAALPTARNAWNQSPAGVTLCEGDDCGSYSSGDGTITVFVGGTCGDGVACLIPSLSNYPHQTDNILRIEASPTARLGARRYWTNDLDDARRDYRYFYLPAVIMHEFGHAFGIGHNSSVASGSVMTHAPKTESGLSNYDVQAMQEALRDIDSHD